MTIATNFQNGPFMDAGEDAPFGFQAKPLRPALAPQIAGMIIAGCAALVLAILVALQPFSVKASNAALAVQTPVAALKADREATALPGACSGQAWGAYSADCATALNGQSMVRTVSFDTVTAPAADANTTILLRVPRSS